MILRRAVERSLIALGVERLFLLQLHAVDSRVPFEQTLAALADLQREGKVEHLGLCNISAAQLQQAPGDRVQEHGLPLGIGHQHGFGQGGERLD